MAGPGGRASPGSAAGAGQAIPPAASGTPVITALAGGTTGFFADQFGSPRLLMADNPWALIPSAGRWGGTWQGDLDSYCNSRGSQKFTAVYTDPYGNSVNYAPTAPFSDGRTWDGVWPFTANGTAGSTTALTGTETIGLNSAFWQRVDYFIAGCARNGMTAWLNVAYTEGTTGDLGNAGTTLGTFSASQQAAYGGLLAARYKNTQNIIWTFGNDYFASWDTTLTNFLTGLRNGGDTHLVSIHYAAEQDSRYDFGTTTAGTALAWGGGHAQFSMVYTYMPTYFGVEFAYTETAAPSNAAALIPVAWGDGYFFAGNGAQTELGMRQMAWWALSSGARGISTGSEGIWQWPSTAPAAVTSENWFNSQAGVAYSLVTGLAGWQKLIPDTGNALITAGRGTRTSGTTSGGGGTAYGDAITDTYVSASRVADGSLALIYFSEGAHANTITINTGLMQAGFTGTWYDPVSGASTAAGTGPTYTPPAGTNSSGVYHDRVLVLKK